MRQQLPILASFLVLAAACQATDATSTAPLRTVPHTPRNGGETVDFGNGGGTLCFRHYRPLELGEVLERGLLSQGEVERVEGAYRLPLRWLNCDEGEDCADTELTLTTEVLQWFVVEQVATVSEAPADLCPNFVAANVLVESQTEDGSLRGAQYLQLQHRTDGTWYGESKADPLYYLGTLLVPVATEATKLEEVTLTLHRGAVGAVDADWEAQWGWAQVTPRTNPSGAVEHDYQTYDLAWAGERLAPLAEQQPRAPGEWRSLDEYETLPSTESYEVWVELVGTEGAEVPWEVRLDGEVQPNTQPLLATPVSLGKLNLRTLVEVQAHFPEGATGQLRLYVTDAEGAELSLAEDLCTVEPCDSTVTGLVLPPFRWSFE